MKTWCCLCLVLLLSFVATACVGGAVGIVSAEPRPPEEGEPAAETDDGLGITAETIIGMARGRNWLPLHRFEMADGTLVNTAGSRGPGNIRLLTFRHPDADYPSTVIFRAASDFRDPLGDELLRSVRDEIPTEIWGSAVSGSAIFGDWRLFLICLNNPADFDFGQLPLTLGEYVNSDFFQSEERGEALINLRNAGDFRGMEALVQGYIEELGIAIEETDSAFLILEQLAPLLAALDHVEIVYDNSTETARIFYRGLTDLGRDVSFVPYVTAADGFVNVLIGFHHDWRIFAERARVHLTDGEIITFAMGIDANWDVIGGAEIRESRSFRLSANNMGRLHDARGETIRFEGDQNIERDLSEAEQDAFEVVYLFRTVSFFESLRFAMELEF